MKPISLSHLILALKEKDVKQKYEPFFIFIYFFVAIFFKKVYNTIRNKKNSACLAEFCVI